MTTFSPEKPISNLDLHVQPVADFAVRVCAQLDFPVRAFLGEHKQDIQSLENSVQVLNESVKMQSE